MVTLAIRKKTLKYINTLPPKHKKQIRQYLSALTENPLPHDAKPLKGYKPYLRADAGEYRIVYQYSKKESTITIALVGKRNGDEVYRLMKNIL